MPPGAAPAVGESDTEAARPASATGAPHRRPSAARARLHAAARRVIGRHPRRRAAAISLAALTLGAGYPITLWNRIERFQIQPSGSASGGTTYLLVGSDSREYFTDAEDLARYGGTDRTPGERADVILAVRVEADGSNRLLAISRDLLIVDDRNGLGRLTHFMADGPQGLVDGLCRSLGLGVDHVLVVHLAGLKSMVDAVGGLDLGLPTAVRDLGSGLALPAGESRLDGDDVLAYVGSRRLESLAPDGTWIESPTEGPNRPGRAVEVLRLLGAQFGSSSVVSLTAHRLAWASAGAVSMDDEVGVGDALRLRVVMSGFDELAQVELPVTSTGTQLRVDELAEGAGAILKEFEGADRSGPECRTPAFPVAARK